MTGKDIADNPRNWQVTIIRTLDQIEAIRPVWEKMQADEPYPVINSDIDRYLSVLQAAEDECRPLIILLKQSDQPRAMIIGRLARRGIPLRVGYKTILKPELRCLGVVYGGILGGLTVEICTILVQELMQTLARDEADVVLLNHLKIGTSKYYLCKKKPSLLCRGHFSVVEKHWQTKVPDTVEALYSRFGRKRRKEWKRLSRRLEEAAGGQIEVKSYRHECQIDEFARIASKISAVTYKDKIGAGFEDTSQTRSLLVQAAQSNWWRGYVLYAGDEPCAFESGVIYGRTYFAEVIGYEPHWGPFSPGTILFIKVLEELCRSRSVNIFDYGFGNAEYKERFGTESWLESSVHIFAPRPYPILINTLQTIMLALNSGLKYIVNRAGMLNWIKRCWRDLLQVRSVDKRH